MLFKYQENQSIRITHWWEWILITIQQGDTTIESTGSSIIEGGTIICYLEIDVG